MSAVMTSPRFASAQAYLDWEAQQTARHELVAGEVYAMTGARATHNTITINALVHLRQALKGTPCRVHGLDLKLRVNAQGDFFYPDAMVSCDARDRLPVEDRFISHPWLVVEVLSDSTAAYDRGRKFELYRGIDTLTHYLLVEQDRPYAELFFRNAQGQWVLQPLPPGSLIEAALLGQPWPVDSLFYDVDFSLTPAARTLAETGPDGEALAPRQSG